MILFLPIIITAINREYLVREDTTNRSTIEVHLWLKEHSARCWYASRNLVVQVDHCWQYPVGTQLTLFSSSVTSTANTSKSTIFIDRNKVFETIALFPHQQSLPKRIASYFFRLRYQLRSSLLQVLPEESAQLLFALILGGSGHLSGETKSQVKTAGLQHLLAASGMHVSLLVVLLLASMKNYSRRSQNFVVSVILLAYACLALLSVSVIRASLMCLIAILARASGRQYKSIWILSLLACLFVLFDTQMVSSISFQLSFGAVLAINLFLTRKGITKSSLIISLELAEISSFSSRPFTSGLLLTISRYVRETLKVSAVVQLFLLPLLLYHFGEMTLVGLLSSVVVLWLLPVVFSLGIGTIILAFVITQLHFAHISILASVMIVPFISALQFLLIALSPLAWLRVAYEPSFIQVAGYYVGMGAVYVGWSKYIKKKKCIPIEHYL